MMDIYRYASILGTIHWTTIEYAVKVSWLVCCHCGHAAAVRPKLALTAKGRDYISATANKAPSSSADSSAGLREDSDLKSIQVIL